MDKYSREQFDVLVVGGGPAGIAAAVRAAEAGARVGIVDENLAPGGQIWRRGPGETEHSPAARRWLERLKASGVTSLCGQRVFHQPQAGVLMAEGSDEVYEIGYGALVLATGARERFLPFPGWTLPNVMGAGGLQAMVKSGMPIDGKRVVIAGSGPLLLAVAAYLHAHGAKLEAVAEQAPMSRLERFTLSLAASPAKLLQAAS